MRGVHGQCAELALISVEDDLAFERANSFESVKGRGLREPNAQRGGIA